MSEWINVNDKRKPPAVKNFDRSINVLLCLLDRTGYRTVTIGNYDKVLANAGRQYAWHSREEMIDNNIHDGTYIVTHWMEIPQLPSEENDGT